MCVAIPSQVVDIEGATAIVDVGGARRKVSLLLLPDVAHGDYVIVHAGFAIKKIDELEAMETLRVLREIAEKSPVEGFETYGDPPVDEGD